MALAGGLEATEMGEVVAWLTSAQELVAPKEPLEKSEAGALVMHLIPSTNSTRLTKPSSGITSTSMR